MAAGSREGCARATRSRAAAPLAVRRDPARSPWPLALALCLVFLPASSRADAPPAPAPPPPPAPKAPARSLPPLSPEDRALVRELSLVQNAELLQHLELFEAQDRSQASAAAAPRAPAP